MYNVNFVNINILNYFTILNSHFAILNKSEFLQISVVVSKDKRF